MYTVDKKTIFGITLSVAVSIFLIFNFCGCEFLWNLTNAGTLKSDIVQLARDKGVNIVRPTCRMLGTTRVGMCQFDASAADIATLVAGLELKEINSVKVLQEQSSNLLSDEDRAYYFLKETTLNLGCENCDLYKDVSKVKIYKSRGKTDKLRLKNGSVFAWLVLYYNVEKNKACIQVCYAYG